MPYFVILTYFAIAILAWGSVIGLCAAVPNLRAAVPYCWRMLVGSSVGFVLANLASLAFGLVPVLIALLLHIDRDHPAAQLVSLFVLLGLFIGPLVVSPLGFIGGALVGLRRAWRMRHATG
jgi:hypothetical protein